MKRPRATIVFVITCSLFVTCGVSSASPPAAGRLPVPGSMSPASVYSPGATSPTFPVSVKSGDRDGADPVPARPDPFPVGERNSDALRNRGGEPSCRRRRVLHVAGQRPADEVHRDETSAEDYLYLKPDLVIFAFPSGTLLEQLQKLQIPVLAPTPRDDDRQCRQPAC